jgi:transposase
MFVGMDLHKNYLQIALMDKKGKVLRNSRIDNNLKHITRFFESINSSEKPLVVMESSSVWYNIYHHLSEERKLDVVLSNPIKTRAIASAKIKTDKLDAVKLADLLRGGYIAECYVPDRRIMDLRELVRHRAALVRMRTKLKNKIHSIVLMKGITVSNIDNNNHNHHYHPFTKRYNEILRGVNDYRVNDYLRLIESLDIEIKEITNKILSIAKEHEMAKLLMTIPGVGYYSALLIVSEIGDINRFPDSYHLCSYAGLVPSTHSSGGVTYHGKITKTGSRYLRWVLLECVHVHIRTCKHSNITRFYERLVKRKGSSMAAVAAAAKLLKVAYWVMKEKREYHNHELQLRR